MSIRTAVRLAIARKRWPCTHKMRLKFYLMVRSDSPMFDQSHIIPDGTNRCSRQTFRLRRNGVEDFRTQTSFVRIRLHGIGKKGYVCLVAHRGGIHVVMKRGITAISALMTSLHTLPVTHPFPFCELY